MPEKPASSQAFLFLSVEGEGTGEGHVLRCLPQARLRLRIGTRNGCPSSDKNNPTVTNSLDDIRREKRELPL